MVNLKVLSDAQGTKGRLTAPAKAKLQKERIL